MLSASSLFSSRMAAKVYTAAAKNIFGAEWMCTNKDGKGVLMTTGPGSAPSPPDYILMALGSCIGYGVKAISSKMGKPIRAIDVTVEGEWAPEPDLRFSEIRFNIDADADMTKEELLKVIRIAEEKACPVSNTLTHSPTIKASASIKKKK